jgi:arylsulfatase A
VAPGRQRAVSFSPLKHGFDRVFRHSVLQRQWPVASHQRRELSAAAADRWRQVVEHQPGPDAVHHAGLTERAVKFIGEHKDQPFFVYLPHRHAARADLFASDKFKRAKSERGLYRRRDRGDRLERRAKCWRRSKEHGLDEQYAGPVHARTTGRGCRMATTAGSAGPLREGKGTTWDGGHRVPCVVRWPGKIPAGQTCDRNWRPRWTCCRRSRSWPAAKQPDRTIDGRDIWPLLSGQAGAKSPHEAVLLLRGNNGLEAVRSGPWKLHLPHEYLTSYEPRGRGRQASEHREPEACLHADVGRPRHRQPARLSDQAARPVALSTSTSDLGETTNVAERHPDVVERLLDSGRERPGRPGRFADQSRRKRRAKKRRVGTGKNVAKRHAREGPIRTQPSSPRPSRPPSAARRVLQRWPFPR